MKRFFAAFLAAMMIVLMVVPMTVTAADVTPITITASKTTANVGEDVVFTVNIKNASKIAIMGLQFQYNTDAFEWVSGDYTATAKMDWVIMNNTQFFGEVVLEKGVAFASAMFANTATWADLDILQFTLKAKKTVEASTVTCTVLSFQWEDGDKVAHDVTYTITPATVSVVCEHTFGDWEKNNAETHKHTCSACGEVAYEDHKWDAGVVTTPPSHMTEGTKTYTCTVCGETKTETIDKTTDHSYGDWVDAKDGKNHKKTCECGHFELEEHKWDAGVVTKEPSHMATGVKTYTCTVCKATKTETLDKTTDHGYGDWVDAKDGKNHKKTCECGHFELEEHKWNAGEVTKAPDCKNTGIKTYTCTVCGATKTETLETTNDHKYGDWTKADDNQHKHTCSVCGKTENADHKWNAGVVTTPPSHVNFGVKTYTCADCGATKTEQLDKTTDHGYGDWVDAKDGKNHKKTCECGHFELEEHKWNAGEVTKAPDCKNTGIKTYTCTVCGATKTETLETTNDHKYGDWTKADDNQHKHTCSVCGKTENADHKWNAGVVTTSPSHVNFGVKTYTCADCGATKTEQLDKTTDHGYGDWVDTKDGKNHKHTCECGHFELEEHKWNAGEVTKAPDCKNTGIKTYTCTVCGATKTETLETTNDHKYGDWTKIDDNQHKHTCSVCGKTENADHKWNAGEVTKAPDCKNTGIKTYTCTDCGATKTETLPTTENHVWDAGKVTSEATCKDAGEKLYTCTVCAKTKTEAIPVTGVHTYGDWKQNDENTHKHECEVCGKTETRSHTWDKGVVTIEPSTGKDGEALHTCTACGATKTVVLSARHECDYGTELKYDDSFHWFECKICLGMLNTQKHEWQTGEIVVPATHTTEGKAVYTCKHCDVVKEDVIPTVGDHSFGDWTKYNASSHVRTCECGEAQYDGHHFGAWTVQTVATTTAEGLEVRTCADCDAFETRTIPKLPAVNENEYQITFHNVYGAADSVYTKTVKIGAPCVFDIAMSREGYTFGGWYQDEACTKAFDISAGKNDTANVDLYARWIQNEKAIVISVEGATPINMVAAIVEGERILAPVVSLNPGEKVEWYADAAFTVPFDFDADVDYVASMTLYAKIVKDEPVGTDPAVTETTAAQTTETTDAPKTADEQLKTEIIIAVVCISVAIAIGVVVIIVTIKKQK